MPRLCVPHKRPAVGEVYERIADGHALSLPYCDNPECELDAQEVVRLAKASSTTRRERGWFGEDVLPELLLREVR